MIKQRKNSSQSDLKTSLPHFLIKRFCEGGFILILTIASFILLSLLTYHEDDPGWYNQAQPGVGALNAGGYVGAYVADSFYLLFGYCAYALPIYFSYIAAMILIDYKSLRVIHKSMLWLRGIGLLSLTLGGCALLSEQMSIDLSGPVMRPGGIVGQSVATTLGHAFNAQGSLLLFIAMILVGITWLTGISWMTVTEEIGRLTCLLIVNIKKFIPVMLDITGLLSRKLHQYRSVQIEKAQLRAANRVKKSVPRLLPKTNTSKVLSVTAEVVAAEQVEKVIPNTKITKLAVSGGLPELSLLDKMPKNKPTSGYLNNELESLSREVEQHLLDFGIQADVVAVHPGPVITRFELQLAAGIKVSRLTALAKDLARSLSVSSVRVVEIIPGKTVVGIELPNPNRAMVCLSEVLSSVVYQEAHSALTLALGVDIAGHPMVVDLAKMPHLLVAGTTGSGKSVGINAMILSLLFKATPEQVRLILIDPKMLELSVYDGIPHLLTPVVTDMKEAASALRWCVAEMERRYRLMSALGVRNIIGYNTKLTEAIAKGEPIVDPLWKPTDSAALQAPLLDSLPYVVVVIDELADMMMVVGKKVEQLIARIAQKARAAGIHLILATQRPSVDVLTGLIKSNIPTRISFQVSSKIDSRTILDQQGAEQLLGHGDMLFLAPGTGAPLRVHGAFVDDTEVHRIADDWRKRGEPQYIEEITQLSTDNLDGNIGDEDRAVEEADVLYDQAVEFVIQTRKASISAVQRRFKIGYNRAARLVEEMERTGLVGPLEGGFRDVLRSSVHEE